MNFANEAERVIADYEEKADKLTKNIDELKESKAQLEEKVQEYKKKEEEMIELKRSLQEREVKVTDHERAIELTLVNVRYEESQRRANELHELVGTVYRRHVDFSHNKTGTMDYDHATVSNVFRPDGGSYGSNTETVSEE